MSFDPTNNQHVQNVVVQLASLAAGIVRLNTQHDLLTAASTAHGIVETLQSAVDTDPNATLGVTGVTASEALAAVNAMFTLKAAHDTVDTSAITSLATHPFMPRMQ